MNILNTKPLNIGIAGAGIMGRMLAWDLTNAGHYVSIFDKDPIEHGDAAAYTAAGMLAPYSEIESADLLVYQMGMKSLMLWPNIIKQLDTDVSFHQSGSLIVAHAQDNSDHQRFKQQVVQKLAPKAAQLVELNKQQLQQLEPDLTSNFNEATYLPEEAWLSATDTMNAFKEKLLKRSIEWYYNTFVNSVDNHKIIANEKCYQFDWAIDTRGLGAKPQWNELRGVRGELMLLNAPEVTIQRLVRLMHPRYRLYVVPRGKNNIYTIGATQIESNDTGPISVRSSLELLSAAYSIHPAFAEAKILESKTNCRPALQSNLPRVECSNGLIRVNGLFRHGFLLAPTVSEEVTQWINANGSYQSTFTQLINDKT